MTQEPLSAVIAVIDLWIVELQTIEEMQQQARQSGSDFFSFMTRRGVYKGWIARLIMDVSGHHPSRLWRLKDAAALRSAIQAYEYAIAAVGYGERQDNDDARRHAQQVAQEIWRQVWQD